MATNPNLSSSVGLTINMVSAVASAGSTSTITTTTTTSGMINGQFVTTYAAANNAATPTTDATTAKAFVALQPSQCCTLVFGQNAAGTLKMVQGPIIGTLIGVTTTVGSFYDAPQFPQLPDDFMAFAYTVVRTAPSAAAWIPGTGSWTDSGISATTFKNVGQLPSRPQIA